MQLSGIAGYFNFRALRLQWPGFYGVSNSKKATPMSSLFAFRHSEGIPDQAPGFATKQF